ncbi:hypothetical protein RB195_003231 [Necator americanus]|uniref:IMS import disulfide relay-system CHCH-CHCH-like Cx9C domain-containing protein n=1 Tax=Necator americanus TaxID=51031 RepID=A0ABR1DMN9_NECAM
MPNERRLLKLATNLAECLPQATAYGTCVSNQAERITKDACADEFSKLLDCVKKQVISLKISPFIDFVSFLFRFTS